MIDKQLMEELEQMEKEAKAKVDNGQDLGHSALVVDLKRLLAQAEAFAFHDYLNDEYPSPKVELAARLEGMRKNVMLGTYDN